MNVRYRNILYPILTLWFLLREDVREDLSCEISQVALFNFLKNVNSQLQRHDSLHEKGQDGLDMAKVCAVSHLLPTELWGSICRILE